MLTFLEARDLAKQIKDVKCRSYVQAAGELAEFIDSLCKRQIAHFLECNGNYIKTLGEEECICDMLDGLRERDELYQEK